MREPPRVGRVPFRKIRRALARILRYLRSVRPIAGNGVVVTATGWYLSPQVQAAPFRPQWLPTITKESSSFYLSVEPESWIGLPREDTAGLTHDVPTFHCDRFMTELNGTDLNDDSGGGFPLSEQMDDDATYWWFVKVTLERRTAPLGATDNQTTSVGEGAKVHIDPETFSLTIDSVSDHAHNDPISGVTSDAGGHSHTGNVTITGLEAQDLKAYLGYHVDEDTPPELVKYKEGIDDLPEDTDLNRHFRAYKFVFADGKETRSSRETYLQGYFTPPIAPYVQSTDSTADAAANPINATQQAAE